MDEMTLELNSPITEEQWDAITDVDFEHTDRIWFHAKNGKDVEFVKRKKGEWIDLDYTEAWLYKCDQCGRRSDFKDNFCPNCGAEMET